MEQVPPAEAGTVETMQFPPGEYPYGMTDFQGSLLLLLSTGGTGNVARITQNGTVLTRLTDFEDSSPYATQSPVVFGDVAYFVVQYPGAGELWVTDGTVSGTGKLIDLTTARDSQAWRARFSTSRLMAAGM